MRKLVLLVLIFGLWPAWALADGARSPEEARQICAEAMNANPAFAQDILRVALTKESQTPSSFCSSVDTQATHQRAADDVAMNEHHVILAYAAMWVVAALFVIFLWRRQQLLRGEIARLRKDLDAAAGGK